MAWPRGRSREPQPTRSGCWEPLAAMTEVLRDHQRRRVYAWEERFAAPRDSSSVAFAQAQGMVDVIWADMSLQFPPKVTAAGSWACTPSC
jgi:hypothetical protein